ncbi:MAG TPA: hypothetical protein VGF45_00420 [Polyangia bacterium]
MSSRNVTRAGWRTVMRILVLGLSIGGLMTVGPSEAAACSCAYQNTRVPAPGAEGVATNTRIWLTTAVSLTPAEAGFRLNGPDGDVAVSVTRHSAHLPSDAITILSPATPLKPNSAYRVFSGAAAAPITHFTTGSNDDTGTPELPRELSRRSTASFVPRSSCGEIQRSIQADVPFGSEFLFVHLTGGPDMPAVPGFVAGEKVDGPPYVFAAASPTVVLGPVACAPWPSGFEAGWVWYGAMDAAGNFSGWSTGGPIALPPLPSADAGVDDAASPSFVDADGGTSDAPSRPTDTGPGGGGCSLGSSGPSLPTAPALLMALALVITWRRRTEKNAGAGSPPQREQQP